jgi:outer membrane beta-barrel protein
MEGRIQRTFLNGKMGLLKHILLALALMGSLPCVAEDQGTLLDDVISPDIERRQIDEDKLDHENIEVGFYGGILSFEDFGSNDVFGARLGLAITEDFFVEANAATSTLEKTSFELLSGDTQLLDDEQRRLIYYTLSLGINLFPGEIYIGRWAFHNNLYFIGGAGNTNFADNEYFTYVFGGGWRLFLTDWLALRVDFRNHLMEHKLFGDEKKIQNLEGHLGFTLYL